jgi:hypothetical protein
MYGKYVVKKVEHGESVEDCFVLWPEKDRAAAEAIRAYAAATDNKDLAADLLAWVGGDDKPLTLDELLEMDGQPVWIVEYPDWGHWELAEDAGDYLTDRYEEFYNMRYDDQEGHGGLHKLGWLAYRRKPCGETGRNRD